MDIPYFSSSFFFFQRMTINHSRLTVQGEFHVLEALVVLIGLPEFHFIIIHMNV